MHLYNTIMYSKICAGDQIKYRRTVDCNFKIMNSKDNLFLKLMNYLNSSIDLICISYPIS